MLCLGVLVILFVPYMLVDVLAGSSFDFPSYPEFPFSDLDEGIISLFCHNLFPSPILL